VFQYTIQAGYNDSDGISIVADALALNSGTIRDPAGNNATLTHDAVPYNTGYKVDTTAPTVDNFTLSDTALKAGDTATVTLDFSEPVTGFNNADITGSNGSLATMTSSDNKTWTGTFTPAANTEEASNTLRLGGPYYDPAGNTGTDNTTSNYEIDTLAPTGSLSLDDYLLKPGDNATVELVFSEPVTGFDSDDDITHPEGTLPAMTLDTSDNVTWTGIFTPIFVDVDAQDWINTLSLGTNYTDIAGNTGTDNTSLNYMVDEILPSVVSFTITGTGIPETKLLYGHTATVRLVFSEPVDNFSSASDISLTNANGTLTTQMTVDSSDNVTWTGIFTPAADTEDASNTLSLDDSWTDIVGNAGTDNTTANYEVETKRPSASTFTLSDTDPSYIYGSRIALKPGDNATVTLVFSEPVDNFSRTDITADSGTLSAMTLDTSDNVTWTGIFTPDNDTHDYSNDLTLNDNSYTDKAGNLGTSKNTLNYVVDTLGPIVLSRSPLDGRCIPVTDNITVTFDGPMEPSYITTTTSPSTPDCAGSIQVSSDNFSTCVRMSANPVAEDDNVSFTLDPYDNLSYYTTYIISVKTGVNDVYIEDALGNARIAEDNSSFYTSSSPSSHSSSVSGVFVGVGAYGKITRSTDNGSSWDNETCQISTDLRGVSSGNNTFVAVGNYGKILRSTDNGSSFSTVAPYRENNGTGVTFGNNTFVGISGSGKIGRSTDNGSSFSNVSSTTSRHLYGAAFGNNTFVVVGNNGRIVRSTDNGSSWNSATSGNTQHFQGITFGNNTFVGVGNSGKIVRSTDNGSSWDNATSAISPHFREITFGNNTFVAVGYSGKIVRSTDNGSTFSEVTSPIGTNLYGVTFGNNTFVAVGNSGKIVRSTDNGSSFSEVTSPITTDLNDVSFSE
jgi:photosystem II stability/assembly factor-like uncharacterized protein